MVEETLSLVRQDPPQERNQDTWTLHSLADEVASRFEEIESLSHETIRQFLKRCGGAYYRAKEWLTSPDPLYELRKHQLDRLLKMARTSPDGAAVWLDECWFVRWPYRYWRWALEDEPSPRVPKRWNEDVDRMALYATLDDETQEPFLRWIEGQPNSDRTVEFLIALMEYWNTKGKRFIVLFWDKASWHTSKQTRAWIRAYNQLAKQEGLTRLLICTLPSRSPWLMPLEAVFGAIKYRVLGGRIFDTVAHLQEAVVKAFHQRIEQARIRRDQTWSARLAA